MNQKEIDQYIGQRLRSLRQLRGISQNHIGERTGLTFQQIQKYETGKNRMGGSRIYQIANILGVSPLYFFEGLPGIHLQNPAIIDMETAKIANLIQDMDDHSKKAIGQLVRSFACK